MNAFNIETLNRRYGPWISLILGGVTVLVFRRGLEFAPIGLAYLILGWLLTIFISTVLPQKLSYFDANNRRRKLFSVGKKILEILSVGFYQNVLFYLIPIWFASTVFFSANMVFPVILILMAMLSCFDYYFKKWVIDREIPRTIWSAIILFSALIPALASILSLPLKWYVVTSAVVASLVAGLAIIPRIGNRMWVKLLIIMMIVAVITGLVTIFRQYLPPVPIICIDSKAGTEVVDREVKGISEVFPHNTPRIYAWFAVSAPKSYRQRIYFQWSRDGEEIGKPIPSETIGGRKGGFRTWTYIDNPRKGDWKAELKTIDGQLIGRVTFLVE